MLKPRKRMNIVFVCTLVFIAILIFGGLWGISRACSSESSWLVSSLHIVQGQPNGSEKTSEKPKQNQESGSELQPTPQEKQTERYDNKGNYKSWWGNFFCQVKASDVAIAFFTCVLVIVVYFQTCSHDRVMREMQRAYIWGGGGLDPANPRIFQLQVDNYGKTPGLLTKYAVGCCSAHAIACQQEPEYDLIVTEYHDWIMPDLMNWSLKSVPLPDIDDPIIFGRFWFEDVWGEEHSTGFILTTVDRPPWAKEIQELHIFGDEKIRDTSGVIPQRVKKRISRAYTDQW